MHSNLDSAQRKGRDAVEPTQLRILSVDIGGTLIKASVIDADGEMLAPWVRVPTPSDATPANVLSAIEGVARDLPPYHKMSVAFPGVIKNGVVKTAPNLASAAWHDHDLRASIQSNFGCDVRILNDAIVQGLGVARGPGLQCVLTLGTGLGFALFRNGRFLVQLELGQHAGCAGMNFDEYVGHNAYVTQGAKEWNSRVEKTLAIVRSLVSPDRILIGGGNARRLELPLHSDIDIFPMTAGITGGARLWADHSDASLSQDFA